MRRPAARRRIPWPSGSHVLLRHVKGGRTWCALPVTLLHDDPRQLVLRIHAGTTWLAAHRPDGRRAHGWEQRWRLRHIVWEGHDATYVIPWHRWYGVAVFTQPGTDRVIKWYVNCQDPLRRMPWGVDTMDRELDVVLAASSAGSPRWKDMEKFSRLVRTGAFSRHQARRMLSEARQARAQLKDPGFRSRLEQWLNVVDAPTGLNDLLSQLPIPVDLRARMRGDR